MFPTTVFQGVRRASYAALLIVIGLHLALKTLFFNEGFLVFADHVYYATRGMVSHSGIAGLIQAVVVLGYLLLVARLRPSDIGLTWEKLPNAMVVTFFLWSLAQVVSVIIGRADQGWLDFGFPWMPDRSGFWLAVAESQAVTALIEEVVFRGLLIPQVFFLLRAVAKWSVRTSMVSSIVITQLYFAMNHLPAAVRMSIQGPESYLYILQVFCVGLLLAAVYLRTGNLFVAIGIHGLVNFPAALFVSRVNPSIIVLTLSCFLLICWPYLGRAMHEVFTTRPGMMPIAHANRTT